MPSNEDDWKTQLRVLVANSETVRKDWRFLANELLKTFPTLSDYLLNIGTIGDAIVDGFTDEEKRIYLMIIPRKKKNIDDGFDITRKRKRELINKKNHYLNLLRKYMFEKVEEWELSLGELDDLFEEKERANEAIACESVGTTESGATSNSGATPESVVSCDKMSETTETSLIRGLSAVSVEKDQQQPKRQRSLSDSDVDISLVQGIYLCINLYDIYR